MLDNVSIVDLGWGNIQSVRSSLLQIGIRSDILKLNEIETWPVPDMETIIFPGIGSAEAFAKIPHSLRHDIKQRCLTARKVIGICLGAQILCNYLEEANCSGLQLFPANVARCDNDMVNIGYRQVDILEQQYRIYHCHGYQMNLTEALSEYFQKDNILLYAKFENIHVIQGHPEKSSRDGLKLLKSIIVL